LKVERTKKGGVRDPKIDLRVRDTYSLGELPGEIRKMWCRLLRVAAGSEGSL